MPTRFAQKHFPYAQPSVPTVRQIMESVSPGSTAKPQEPQTQPVTTNDEVMAFLKHGVRSGVFKPVGAAQSSTRLR